MTPDARPSRPEGQERISRQEFERLISIRGEGDEWDFKESLGDLAETAARVNVAKDALAFCNLPEGGTIVVGVADDFSRVGLRDGETIDTTALRNAVQKFIDGEFVIFAAEHVSDDDAGNPARFGIVHFARRSAQPVLAAQDGNMPNPKPPLFRSGDVLIRRGAASVRANSGDVRRLLTSTVVNEARLQAVNELWTCVTTQRGLLIGVETVYEVLLESEYHEVSTKPELRAMVGTISGLDLATKVQDLQQRVNLVRPHLPEELFVQYRLCSSFVGRIHMKAARQIAAYELASWTDMDDGTPDVPLRELATRLLAPEEIETLWRGQTTSGDIYRPLRPAVDATERDLLAAIRRVLSGLA